VLVVLRGRSLPVMSQLVFTQPTRPDQRPTS